MSVAFAAILLFILVLALTVLPFIPAIVEWRRKTDAEPLAVVYSSAVDVRHFANGFRDYITDRLGGLLEVCRDKGMTEWGKLDDGTPFVAVGHKDAVPLTADEIKARASHHVIVSSSDLLLPERMMFLPEIYADGTIRSGDRNIFRAVLAEEDVQLGRESLCLRWLHAARAVTALSGSALYGRASADQVIRLERGCRFERLNAPRVEFCYRAPAGEFAGGSTYNETALVHPRDLPNRIEVKAGRWLVSGDLEIPAGKIVKTNVVATGKIRIRPGVHIVGNIKSHGDMVLERGVEVDGSVVSARDIEFDAGCRIYGPVLAERSISIGEGTVIGTATRPTTVTAEKIIVEPGVVAHGTVWAHVEGRVAVDIASGRYEKDKDTERKSA
jgi:cytoskeletal protein CcmA (bactofilin family)